MYFCLTSDTKSRGDFPTILWFTWYVH